MPVLSNDKLIKQWEKHKGISGGDLNAQHKKARIAHQYVANDEAVYNTGAQRRAKDSSSVW